MISKPFSATNLQDPGDEEGFNNSGEEKPAEIAIPIATAIDSVHIVKDLRSPSEESSTTISLTPESSTFVKTNNE